MTEDKQFFNEFYRKDFGTNGMTNALYVFVFSDKEIPLDAIKHPRVLGFLCSDGGTTRKLLLEQFNFILKMFFTEFDFYNLRNRMVKKTESTQ